MRRASLRTGYKRNTVLACGAAIALAAVSGCQTPVGVRVVDQAKVQRMLNVSALSANRASVESRQVLLRMGLSERFRTDPEAALAELHQHAVQEMAGDELFALAEYSFLHARRSKARGYFVAASIYAYAFLFPDDGSSPPSPFDPRLRRAVNLYNRALARSLPSEQGVVSVREAAFSFHLGILELSVEQEGFRWADRRLDHFVPAAGLEVRGLRNRYRRKGIGAPFVAEARAEEGRTAEVANARLGDEVTVPVTFVLRYADARKGLRTGRFPARLALYSESDRRSIEISGRQVPLEYETSAALAYSLEGAELWDFGLRGFLRGDALQGHDGLFMIQPYVAGRIPIVFIHGTASSPARWAEMLNELESDPRIAEHYQFWFFIYTTGNPILYSASFLRNSLRSVVAELDPDGNDSALRETVLVGHSQGGLLAKLMVIESGDRFWDDVADKPFDAITMEPETRELLSQALFFAPLPFVRRVIFIATPQQGSYIAGRWIGRLGSSLFTAPGELLSVGADLAREGYAAAESAVDAALTEVDVLRGDEGARMRRRVVRIPSSVENMDPKDAFIQTLSSVPVAPGVRAHSIIPVKGDPPPFGQNDGVVTYESAHIEEAQSEYVVYRSGHSTQSNPLTIREVRRILLDEPSE